MHVEAAGPAEGATSVRGLPLVWTLTRCLLAVALILLATTWPISDFQDHAHWYEVEWVPFTMYWRPFDVLANVLLFAPLGAAIVWRSTDPRRVRTAMLTGLALALAVELSQVYTHNRAPTVTDLVANTAGAWLGARWAFRGGPAPHPE